METLDIEEEILDVETLLDSIADLVDDARLTIAATMKVTVKSIAGYSVLLKRNQNKIRELITRYKFEDIKNIPVGTYLGEYIEDRMPMGSEIDILDKLLTIETTDFNLDVLNMLVAVDKKKLAVELIGSDAALDKMGRDVLLSGVVVIDGKIKASIKSRDLGFVTSYVYGKTLKGIMVDKNTAKIYAKSFKFARTPTTPKLISVSLFNTVKDSFLSHNKNDVKVVLNIYKKAIKDTGKYLRSVKDSDGLTVSNSKLLTETVIYHLNYIADSIFKLTDMQYNFLRECLSELDNIGVGGARSVI